MSDSTTIADEQLDYPFLLVTQMVCADQQIHSEESKALHEIANQIGLEQCTRDEMEKIFAQDEQQISLEDITRRMPPGKQTEAMRQILAVAYVDGFFSLLERNMVEQVARHWNRSTGEIQELIAEAESFTASHSIGDDSNQLEVSVGARLLIGASLSCHAQW